MDLCRMMHLVLLQTTGDFIRHFVPLHVFPVSSGASHLFGVLEVALPGMLDISLAAPTEEGHYTDVDSVG